MAPDIPHTENEYKIYEECQDFRHLHYCRGRNGVGMRDAVRRGALRIAGGVARTGA